MSLEKIPVTSREREALEQRMERLEAELAELRKRVAELDYRTIGMAPKRYV